MMVVAISEYTMIGLCNAWFKGKKGIPYIVARVFGTKTAVPIIVSHISKVVILFDISV